MLYIEKNKDLTRFNSFAFSSVAEQFLSIKDEDQVKQSVNYAKEHGLAYQVISGGSNLLIKGCVRGLTVHMQLMGKSVISETANELVLRVSGGENWHETVEYTVNQNWQGLENLALIPGLVGASPVQNIGAYGTELADLFVCARVFDKQHNKVIELSKSECQFGYRDSVFKRNKERYIILSVDLKLAKQHAVCAVTYKALKTSLANKAIQNPSVREVFNTVCEIRSSKLPDPKDLANAGSFFKNPCVSVEQYNDLKARFPEIVGHQVSTAQVKLAAGWLIEHCGWKGITKGGVGVYAKQALVLVHFGGASLQELLQLAEEIKASINTTFKVELEIEPQFFPSQ